ncbi:MAG: hypothetical protein J2P47_07330 [Acetobacteraceae bacterium]|nr:hypothetical protein [Acetobacteraceae bacterium]
MEKLDQAVNELLALLARLTSAGLAGLAAIEQWLRTELAVLGLPREAQTAIMVAAALLLLLIVVRLFGGVIRAVLVLFLILLVLHVVLPMTHA